MVLDDDFGSGYKLRVDVINSSEQALSSWLVRLDLGAPLDKNWNSVLIPEEGDAANGVFAFSNVDFNGEIDPGETKSFGLIVTDPDSSNAPSSGVLIPDWVPNLTPTITGSGPSVQETDSAGVSAVFQFTLNTALSDEVSFSYTTQSGTATAGSDFAASSGTVTFAAGELSQEVTVGIIGDDLDEGTERFSLSLTNAVNADLTQASLTATILDDDAEPLPPSENGGKQQFGKYNYAELLQKSLWFYDAQRSGDLPDNYRVPWRGDSALNDGSDVGLDLTGGLYDAGDHVKFGLPMAYSLTLLSWGAIEYKDSYLETNQWDEIRSLIEFTADYFMRCHVRKDNGDTEAFYGQVGDGNLDHAFWGPAEQMMMARPAFKIDENNPGSDLAAETAASFSAMSIAIRDENPTLADQMVDHAKALYKFAQDNPGLYHESIPNARSFYRSFSADDEMMWGALWLYRATGDLEYLDIVTSNWGSIDYRSRGLDWDSKANGVYVLMSLINGGAVYRASAERYLDNWVAAGGDLEETPGGLISKFPWGTLRHSTTNAFCALLYADKVADPSGDYHRFGRRQIRYALGDNPEDRSYVVGFGVNPPINPHHRGAHSSTTDNIAVPTNNVHTLYGALVGGPAVASNDRYTDDRTDFIANEVAMDYNAGFTGAVAALYRRYGGSPVSDLDTTTPIDPNHQDGDLPPVDPVDPGPVIPNPPVVDETPVSPLTPPTGGYAAKQAPFFNITESNRRSPDPDLYDWSKAGFRGTGVLPTSSAYAHMINAEDFGVIADDGLDDSVALQAAIDSAAALNRDFDNLALIQLPAGEINISRQISMHVSFVVLKGAGSNPSSGQATSVVFRPDRNTRYDQVTTDSNGPLPDFNAMSHEGNDLDWNWPGRGLFKVQTLEVESSYTGNYANAPENRQDIYEGSVNFHWKAGLRVLQNDGLVAAEGSTVIPLADNTPTRKLTPLQVGMSVVVKGADTKNMYLEQQVEERYWRDLFMKMQMVRITAIDLDTKTITIDKPLEFDLYAHNTADGSTRIGGSERQSRVVPITLVEGVGFEDLFITQPLVDAPKLGGGTYNLTWEDAARVYTNIAPEYAIHGIVFRWAADSWVKNVRTFMTGSHAIVTEEARNLQIEDSVFEGSWNKGAGGNGYFRISRAWDCLVHNNTLRQLRHLTMQWSASGNVIIGNHVDCDLNFHGGWERLNLVEQNIADVPLDHKPNQGENWYPIWWATGPKAGKWAGSSGPRNILFNNVLNKQTTAGGAFLPYAPYTNSSLPAGTVVQMGWDRDSVVGSRWEHLGTGNVKLLDWSGSELVDFSTGSRVGVNNRMIRNTESLFLGPATLGDYLIWAAEEFGQDAVDDFAQQGTVWGPQVADNFKRYAFGDLESSMRNVTDGQVTLEYNRNITAGDIQWRVLVSDDLISWDVVDEDTMTEVTLTAESHGSFDFANRQLTIPRSVLDSRKFYRIEATMSQN